MSKTVRIANSSGYWGDDPHALLHQVTDGPIDYLTGDYLAEITMTILERQRRANPDRGFAYDFIRHLRPALPAIVESGVRVVVNAGGVNPRACRDAVARLCEDLGVSVAIATVEGDDVLETMRGMRADGAAFAHLDSGEPADPIADRWISANAYLGARPIARALDEGAQIVVTGRTTDAALALGPMIHELGWAEDDWDRLAAGLIAGHLLECGAQVTGGNFTDFEDVPLESAKGHFGYPVVEMESSGSFVITKPEGTAGLLDRRTVTEQLLYEIGDPRAYRTPDVTCDFTSLELRDDGPDRVRVEGARGRPAPTHLKVSSVYAAGHRAVGTMLLSGPRIRAKARHIETLLWQRIGTRFDERRTDLVGDRACWLGAAPDEEPNEGILRIAVRDGDEKKVSEFANTLMGFGLQGPPGLGMMGGRPVVSPAFGFWPTLIPRNAVTASVSVRDAKGTESTFEVPMALATAADPADAPPAPPQSRAPEGPTKGTPLSRIAYARSGDKGDNANVGVAARSRPAWEFLRGALTAERVAAHFRDLVAGEVVRWELPTLGSFNFLLRDALGGGGTLSLRVDHQGKTLGQGLLLLELDVPESVLDATPEKGVFP